LVGREDGGSATAWSWESRWVGKPWRRVELATHRFTWKGVTEVTDQTLTLHLGWPRFGVSVTLVMARGAYDYSEDRP
jgi:hypothetical protein